MISQKEVTARVGLRCFAHSNLSLAPFVSDGGILPCPALHPTVQVLSGLLCPSEHTGASAVLAWRHLIRWQ